MRNLIDAIALRPVRDTDQDFLFRLYSSTRADELANVPWPEDQKHAFLLQQFSAQSTWWEQQYQGATFDVILVDSEIAGRLYVHRSAREHRVVDIALMPEFRGHGLGTNVLQQVIAEANAAGKPVSIHVEIYNPARRLYERLGFTMVEDKGVYLLMERSPDPAVSLP